VVLGYAEFIQMNDKLEKADLKSLKTISAAATRGAELVQQLLTFCRKGQTKPRLLNLNHQVIQAQKLMERTLPKMIRIELCLDDELPVINADPVQVEQILMNLAINARDAMEQEAGTLSISAKAVKLEKEHIPRHIQDKAPDYVMLSVSDTGCGMAQETLEHIFEPFFTTKDVGQGTGLGLSIVFGIVEQHGGFITCNSSLGNGSTFNVYFPAIQGEPEKDGQRRIVKTGGGSETILIADDDEDVLSLCQSILNRAGYKVLTALNGNEALEIYRKQRDDISLVILDKMMPIMGGMACLHQLLRINPDVRVVIATGFLSEQPDDSIRPGSVELIEKPYSVQALLHAVRKTLDGEE
jgi:CheY-like chemotaxis protein